MRKPSPMKPYLNIVTWSLLGCMTFISFVAVADAERLSKSDLGSTLNQQCDLCWYPSPSEERSSHLPTYKQPRHKRPPDSRPQRYPKGRYKLGSTHKQTQPSTLRSRTRQEMRLLSDLQVYAVDGDTIRVGGERIRLRGIDTPEMSEFEGPVAKQRLQELLRTGPIRIVPHARDVYDRLVADVFVNGQNVAEILRNEGFSKAG
ncbi:MAG: thermonuclease family protein [Nitrospira sp.]|nr:thermonuclease family protein [Nitrospira sp.]